MKYAVQALNMADEENSIEMEMSISRSAYCETVVKRAVKEVAQKMRELGLASGSVKWRMTKPNVYYNPWYEVTLYDSNNNPFILVITSDKGVLAQ